MTVEQIERKIQQLRDKPENPMAESIKWHVKQLEEQTLAQLEVALHTARLASFVKEFYYLYTQVNNISVGDIE